METNYYLRIKTGFFKTTLYNLIVKNGLIEFVPKKETDKKISLKEAEIVSILLRKTDELNVDFSLKEGGITGTLVDTKDAQQVFKLLKENINKNIIYEED